MPILGVPSSRQEQGLPAAGSATSAPALAVFGYRRTHELPASGLFTTPRTLSPQRPRPHFFGEGLRTVWRPPAHVAPPRQRLEQGDRGPHAAAASAPAVDGRNTTCGAAAATAGSSTESQVASASRSSASR